MPNLSETNNYEAGIYQLETTDFVIGGASGVSNTPNKQLANRTNYLKSHVDAIEAAPNKYKDILVITTHTTLTVSDIGKLIVVSGNTADVTITLPLTSSITSNGDKFFIVNKSSFVVTVQKTSTNTIDNASSTVKLNALNDFISLSVDKNNTNYIIDIINSTNKFNIVTTTSNNGTTITVSASSGTFAYNNDVYNYSYYIDRGICHLNFEISFDVTSTAIVNKINIPLPSSITKLTTLSASQSLNGIATFKAVGGSTNYVVLQVYSNDGGAEGQRITLKRISDGDENITMSTVSTVIKGEVKFLV